MTISFNRIPQSLRTPGTFLEIDNSRAFQGLNLFQAKIVIIAQQLTSGTIPAGTMSLCTSAEQAKTFWGQGSMMANMFKALKDNGKNIPTYGIGLADAGGGTNASCTVAITGTATENGTIFIYIAGKLCRVPVTNGDSNTVVAASMNSTINGMADLPVTATVSTNTVTITYRHKGTIGNSIDIRLNYYGAVANEKVPAGLTVTVGTMSGGATDPSIQAAINALPEDVYDFIVMPYTDPTNLTALETELADRWSPMRQLYGTAFTFYQNNLAGINTFGHSRNSQFISCFGVYRAPSPTYEWAAAFTSRIGEVYALDPARPATGLDLVGILPPAAVDLFSQQERNTLLYDGISTFVVSRAGVVEVDRVITMYQTNNVDTPDPSYLDLNTMATLAYLCQDAKAFMENTYDGYKIADSGNKIDPGQKVATPTDIRAALIGRSLLWEKAGLVEDIDQFEQDLIVERNLYDKTRVDVQLPPNLVNPLLIFALQMQFRI